MSHCKLSLVRVGSYWYKHKYDIPLSDLNSFRHASTFGTLPISLSFSSPFLSDSARYFSRSEARFFSGSLDTWHIERNVSFQALLDNLTFRVPFLFRLCSILLTFRGPFLCTILLTFRGPFLFRLCSIVLS